MRAATSLGSSSWRGLGAGAAPAAAPVSTDLTQYTTAAAPIIAALTAKDSTESVETLKAQIANHEHLRDTFPEPLKTLYADKVRVLKGKLKAARDLQRRDAEDRASKFEWATLGKTGIATAVVLGGALIILVVSGARRVERS